jgi:hypothetical protein
MSPGIYAVLFVGGAGSIALWSHLRLARFTPKDMRRGMIHMGASMVACQILSPAINAVLTGGGQPELRLLSVIAVSLPALTYALLALIWMITLMQATIRRGMLG